MGHGGVIFRSSAQLIRFDEPKAVSRLLVIIIMLHPPLERCRLISRLAVWAQTQDDIIAGYEMNAERVYYAK